MREILFRAKKDDMSDCSFVYGSLIYDNENNPRIQEDRNLPTFTTCLKGTECQFTGLTDKNGNKIFEGDIINWGMHHPYSEENYHRYAIVELNPDIQFRIIYYINSKTSEKVPTDNHVFRYGSFAYKDTNIHLEIIGNIHEELTTKTK